MFSPTKHTHPCICSVLPHAQLQMKGYLHIFVCFFKRRSVQKAASLRIATSVSEKPTSKHSLSPCSTAAAFKNVMHTLKSCFLIKWTLLATAVCWVLKLDLICDQHKVIMIVYSWKQFCFNKRVELLSFASKYLFPTMRISTQQQGSI